MLRWALKSLFADPPALVAGIAASGSALLLVILFGATWAGESEQIVAYPRNVHADVWVMQSGVANMHMATSYIEDWKTEQVRKVPGVAAVEAILYMNSVVETRGNRRFAYVVGLQDPVTRAGPWAMADGKPVPGPGEVVVPAVYGDTEDLRLGDQLRVVDRALMIVGFSKGTFSMANSVVFVTKQDLEDIMSSSEIVSFMLVTAAPGVDARQLAKAIEASVESVNALPEEEFLANDRALAQQMGVETIALMTFIGGALAVLIVAFMVYSQVTRQRRELAVAKALGATNGSLYVSVLLQSAILVLASVATAILLSVLAIPVIDHLVPMVSLKLTVASVMQVVLAGLVIAILAAVLPSWRIAAVDPLTAFRD